MLEATAHATGTTCDPNGIYQIRSGPCGATPPLDSCFPAGTKVLMEDENQKNIEDVKVGDKVISQSENGKKSVSMVTKLDQPVRDHLCRIKFTDGDNLKLTDEHPLFTQDGWKAINPKNTLKEAPRLAVTGLKKGDEVVKSDGTKAEVSLFSCWSQKVQTYNLILDNGANTYFANGFLVHNKGETPPPSSCVPGCHDNYTTKTGNILCSSMEGGYCIVAYESGDYDCSGTNEQINCGTQGFSSAMCGCLTCSNCGTYPNCYDPYCSASCTYGCSSVSCDGGVCNPPPPTPVPCTTDISANPTTVGVEELFSLSWSNTRADSCTIQANDHTPLSIATSGFDPNNYQYETTAYTFSCNGGECADSVMVNMATPTPTPAPAAGPWWQVVNGDVQTNGDLDSSIPGGYYFGLDGLGGFPGVAKYGGSTSLSSANVSDKGWLANSLYAPANGRVQNYAYFRRLIPEDVVLNPIPSNSVAGSFFTSGGTISDGYYWYEYDASVTGLDLSITSPTTLPDGRKVIILITGANLNIQGSITYTSGESILVALVNGDINIDPYVGGGDKDCGGEIAPL
jgi:hypothetical protein